MSNHRGSLLFVKPEERFFVTATLIRHTTCTGAATGLRERIGALADAGDARLAIRIVPGRAAAIEGWGRIRAAF